VEDLAPALWRGDCLQLLGDLRESTVDLILCDLPYGCTDCKWDTAIDPTKLWDAYRRVLRPNGTVVLFGTDRFGFTLMAAAPWPWFRYAWVWDKRGASGFLNARKRPMLAHEMIFVFSPARPRYYPQGLKPCFKRRTGSKATDVYGAQKAESPPQTLTGYPPTILRFAREKGAKPAAKPVALLEYLIRTYTMPGELVVDNTMGLGSTGVAAVNTGRRFIGMEMNSARFEKAEAAIAAAGRSNPC
jgi:site-specific DNA-methyltransferase (adenine-specific)